MDPAAIYNGSLESDFAKSQDWGMFSLGIFASEYIDSLAGAREQGLKVFSYTHKDDPDFESKISMQPNDGIFLDWAIAPNQKIEEIVRKLHVRSKQLIINSGWGFNDRTDYANADMVMLESFIGTHNGDDGRWPVDYLKSDDDINVAKLAGFKRQGYKTIALSYGPGDDLAFACYCAMKAEGCNADYFMYAQCPGWEKEGSGLRLYSFLKHGNYIISEPKRKTQKNAVIT